MAEMARSSRSMRPLTRSYPVHLPHESPPHCHDSPYSFGKIRSFPYWLIIGLQCRELPCLSFQVVHDGMHDLIEGIIRSGINIQMHVVGCQPDDIDCRVLKGYGCLSHYVSHGLTMFTGKDVDPLSGTEHDMVLDCKVNQVGTKAQLLHRVGSEPFVLGGHACHVFADIFR